MKNLLIPPVYVSFGILIIIGFSNYLDEFNLIPFPINVLGLFIALAGLYIFGTAARLFIKHKTTLQLEEPSYFIKEGFYQKSRNPIYLGMFIFLMGIAVFFQNLLGMLVPFAFILIIHFKFLPREERLMEDTFGEDYIDYKGESRKWF